MVDPALSVPDPRVFPSVESASREERALYTLAETSLTADSRQRADACDRELGSALAAALDGGGANVATLLAHAPSVAVTRHLWRALDAAWRARVSPGLAVTVFALPVVIVVGVEGSGPGLSLPGVLHEPQRLAAILQEHGALRGNRNFAFADVLVAADRIDVARLPEIRAWQRLPEALAAGAMPTGIDLAPAPIDVPTSGEGVHLRFIVGSAIAAPEVDLLVDPDVGRWGIPFAQALGRLLATDGAPVLALPRAPQHLLPAVAAGRSAQREVSAQLFASNAIRRMRGAVGEPSAVISAHRAPDAPGGGELRLSLSSAFDSRGAEGFRCPLYPLDRVDDVVAMLVSLLRDCRVTDIRTVAGVHPDRAPDIGSTLLYKPDTIPDPAQVTVH
ncbi:MAG TPA: hypothetical protein VFJ68_07160 [Casimicrobiaceae bacterium]|nr:hypothetical protein [Casimicrobiaceae bacterium]